MVLTVLVPVLFKMTAPNAVPEPTAPVKVTPPLPLLTVNARAELLLSVVANETNLSVVVKVVSSPKVTASLYVCAPLVVIMPPLMAVVPPMLVVTLVA